MNTMNKPRTRNTQDTTEAFAELAQRGLDELIENSDTLHLDRLADWIQKLKRSIAHASDHATGPDEVEPGHLEGVQDFLCPR